MVQRSAIERASSLAFCCFPKGMSIVMKKKRHWHIYILMLPLLKDFLVTIFCKRQLNFANQNSQNGLWWLMFVIESLYTNTEETKGLVCFEKYTRQCGLRKTREIFQTFHFSIHLFLWYQQNKRKQRNIKFILMKRITDKYLKD